MKLLFKTVAIASALLVCSLLFNNNLKEAFAEEQNILNKEDFEFNASYTQDTNEYSLTLKFVSEEAKQRYENYTLEYDWSVLQVNDIDDLGNTCTFIDSFENSDYIYTVNIIVSIAGDTDDNIIKFTRYLQNGKEVFVKNNDIVDAENSFSLPYFYVPIIAVVLGIGYLICFKTNKLVGSLESTEEKLSVLLSYKEKFDRVLNNQKTKESKKKKQITKLIFTIRGHLYSIRYIIENMSIDNSIDNTELLDQCNAVINSINAIDMKKISIDEVKNHISLLFDRDLAHLLSINKRMLHMQKKYVESTYGKK